MKKEPYLIEGTQKTPTISFDWDKKLLLITGKSIPENHSSFYAPFLAWLDDYVKDPLDYTEVRIQLEYFNTSSSKVLLAIFRKMEDIIRNDKKVEIKWHYEEDDYDMKDCGDDYQSMIIIPFEMIPEEE